MASYTEKMCKKGHHDEHFFCYTPAANPHGSYCPNPSEYYYVVMICCHCGSKAEMGKPIIISARQTTEDVRSWEEIQNG